MKPIEQYEVEFEVNSSENEESKEEIVITTP